MSDPSPATLDAALGEVAALLDRDGFTSAWTPQDGRVVFTVGVGTAECGDCLAPEPVLRMMVDTALRGTGFELDRVEMPDLDR